VLETSARLLRLLALLQSRRDWTGGDLAERLSVTPRTVRADVDRLRKLGYTVDSTLGVNGGYRLGTGANLPPLLLDDDEAVAVVIGLRAGANGAVAGVEETSARALDKIQHLLRPALRRRISALQSFTVSAKSAAPAPSIDTDVLTTLADACRDQTLLRIDYRSQDGSPSRREVESHRLVHANAKWYLVAWDTGRAAWRTFRVDRMRLPKNRVGPRFASRPLPEDDPGVFALNGIRRARWPYIVSLIVHADSASVVGRLPPQTLVEPINDRSCRVELGADSAATMAAWLGVLDADFDIESIDSHPDLVHHLRAIAARYARATT
jgi:predicted DNA-binding transcriptional regulator YafY